jgi:hypothetical protein
MIRFGLSNIVSIVQEAIMTLLFLIIFVGIARKFIKNYFSKSIAVNAKVIDKIATTFQTASSYAPKSKATDYVIVFYANGKTIRFKTSIWIYDSVKKGETGLLKYTGTRLISFN